MSAVIMWYNGMVEMKFWRNLYYHPDMLVYALLCNALGVPVVSVFLTMRKGFCDRLYLTLLFDRRL